MSGVHRRKPTRRHWGKPPAKYTAESNDWKTCSGNWMFFQFSTSPRLNLEWILLILNVSSRRSSYVSSSDQLVGWSPLSRIRGDSRSQRPFKHPSWIAPLSGPGRHGHGVGFTTHLCGRWLSYPHHLVTGLDQDFALSRRSSLYQGVVLVIGPRDGFLGIDSKHLSS